MLLLNYFHIGSSCLGQFVRLLDVGDVLDCDALCGPQ